MAEQFVGKWNNTTSENFDAYLKEIGVGMMTRTVASKLKPTLTFEINGDEWTMTSISTFKTHITKFKLGQEFDLQTIDGRDVKSVFELEGNKLVQTEKGKNGGKDSRIERTINGNTLTIVMSCNAVQSTRCYEKVVS